MKTEQVTGSVEDAIAWLIYELNQKGEWHILDKWDQLRGNDWILTTRLSESKNRDD